MGELKKIENCWHFFLHTSTEIWSPLPHIKKNQAESMWIPRDVRMQQ